MKETLQNNKNIFGIVSGTEKRVAGLRRYIFLAGKIFDITEIGGKIHVFL